MKNKDVVASNVNLKNKRRNEHDPTNNFQEIGFYFSRLPATASFFSWFMAKSSSSTGQSGISVLQTTASNAAPQGLDKHI